MQIVIEILWNAERVKLHKKTLRNGYKTNASDLRIKGLGLLTCEYKTEKNY